MAPDTHWPMWELLMRHGIDWSQARSLSIIYFRHWELKDIENFFSKIKRPSPEYRYFTSDEVKPTRLPTSKEELGPFQKWWPSLWDTPARGISPPRSMVEQSARDGTVLCVNVKGEWSLRTDGYVALSHVWIEGLQREEKYQGLEKTKVTKVFELLARAGLQSEWIWTDVLVIPGGGVPTSSLEDELLTVDLINTMPNVYSQAEAILVIDALVLQLHSTDLIDVAMGLACGKWATRVWTYQEIKLANRAVVVTATGGVEFSDMIKSLKDHEAVNQEQYRPLYLWTAIMAKSDQYRLTIRDLVTACGSRNSGMDIDYARAFFPVLGLKWTNGMTREEGMQMIYYSLPQDTTAIAAFAGSPRMKLDPGWAPSYLTGLEGRGGYDLRWEKRGIRGEWFILRITKLLGTTLPKHGRIGLNLEVDCHLHPTIQCITSRNEYPEVVEAVKTMITKGSGYILSATTFATYSKEWARSVLLAEKATTREEHGLEVAVHCVATTGTPGEHRDEKVSLLIRHGNPNVDSDLPNQVRYHWFCEEETSRSRDLPQEKGETSLHVAVRKGDVAAVRSLLKDRDLINTPDHRGYTPIHTAAARGATEILELLVKNSTNIEVPAKDTSSDTPLALAARRGQAESIKVLLEHGANIENRNDGDYTPLMVASYECHNKVVATLLEKGADPNSRDTRGFSGSPLLLASGRNGLGVETMKLLIQFGADVNPVFHPLGWTPLLKAADMGNDDEVEHLLSVGANPNVKDTSNRTPLRHAIHHAREGTVRMLLDAGADREAVFDDDHRPVHLAATCGNYEIMQMLLNIRAPINVNVRASENLKRATPLHMAVEKKQPTVVKLLLSNGADVNAKDAAGDSPLDYALAGGHDGIQAILKAAGGKGK